MTFSDKLGHNFDYSILRKPGEFYNNISRVLITTDRFIKYVDDYIAPLNFEFEYFPENLGEC